MRQDPARYVNYATFKKKYKNNELMLGMTCSTMSPPMVEILGFSGFDFVVVDMEMLSINPETVESMVRAAECSGIVPIIKLKNAGKQAISDALNTGAPMCKLPHIKSADELNAALEHVYFHPKGKRGLCSVSRANFYAQGKMSELMEWNNAQVQVIPIIEDKEAIDNIDEIMRVEGVEVYDIGPVDLAHSFGVDPGKGFANPVVTEALEKIVAAANKHGKKIMTVPVLGKSLTPDLTREWLIDRGVRMIFYRTDSVNMRITAETAMTLRAL